MNLRLPLLLCAFCLIERPAFADASKLPNAAQSPGQADAAPPKDEKLVQTTEDAQNRARGEARDRFATGLRLYEEGEFSQALIEFERAYSLVPDHRVLYNIGQVSIQLGRYARAVRTLRQYLLEGQDLVPEDRRKSVSADLEMLRTRTATILVSANVGDAEIFLDNDVVATTPMAEPLLIDAGEHRITLKKPGYAAQTKPVALAGRDEVKLAFSLQPEPKAVTTEKTVIVERKLTPTGETTSNRGVYMALGWTGTALCAGSWVATGLLGRAAANDRENAVGEKTTNSELDRLESKAFRYYVASDILAGASLLAAGGMLYYTIAGPSDAKAKTHKASLRRRIAVDFGPGSVAVAGQF